MPHCGHSSPVTTCHRCHLYATDERYRRLWDGLPPQPRREPLRPLPCVHLGELVVRARCVCPREDVYQCDRGHGPVRQAGQCETCEDYLPETDPGG